MELELDAEGLSGLLGSFYDVVGVSIGVFQPDGKRILGKPGRDCEFCRLVKKDTAFAQRCRENDMEAFRRAMNGEQWIYRCHAGLIEAVVPILCGQRPVACLMIGQTAPKESQNILCESLQGHPEFADITEAYSGMQRRTEAELASCARIMAACAGYIYLNRMISLQKESLSERLKAYICANYRKPVMLKEMAAALNVGVTRLCTGVREECGSTPHALLQEYRLDRAKQLLAETELPVREIAAEVGMEDYNYFSRVFRQRIGMTPTQYRAEAK